MDIEQLTRIQVPTKVHLSELQCVCVPLAHVSQARFSQEFIDGTRLQMKEALADSQTATDLRRKQLRNELARLDVQEENLLDLGAESASARQKVRHRLNEIELKRAHLTDQLSEVVANLTAGADLIESVMMLMTDSSRMYHHTDAQGKRLIIQAIFQKLYVDQHGVTDETFREPIAEAVEASELVTPHHRASKANESRQSACSRLLGSAKATLWATALAGHGANKVAMVEIRGFKPRASALPALRSNQLSYIPMSLILTYFTLRLYRTNV